MNEQELIQDNETLLRHIPGGTLWQAPGPRITSANFQLRTDRSETGVSVTRLSFTTPDRLKGLVGGSRDAGSRVAAAQTGEVRALGLKVVPKPKPDDSGHAEIQSDMASLDDRLIRKKLANLFRFLEDPSSS